MKRILITNDDGIYAEGIRALAEKFRASGYEVLAVAPDCERSASGHSMTMTRPLHLNKMDKRWYTEKFDAYSCDGTPTDCVIMGVDVLNFKPDILLSGINCGPNLGDDLTYSGTACAAMEGLIFGYPSMAISLVCGSSDPVKHFDTAADATLAIVRLLEKYPMPADVMYNINVPNESARDVAGVLFTRRGMRRYLDKVTVVKTPFGGETYWLGGKIYDEMDNGTDVRAIADKYISITPVHMEMTDFDAMRSAESTALAEDVSSALKKE